MIVFPRLTRRGLIGALLLGVIVSAGCDRKETPTSGSIRLYAGAGLRRAVAELATTFETESGIAVEVDYSGSGMLIARARQDSEADLFMPGDVWYVDRLHELEGLIANKTSVCYFVPVIIVAKGNPKNITGLADFTRDDVSVALGKAEACQVGRLTEDILTNAGLVRAEFAPKESLTVNELGVWVKMGSVDAAIVWDAIAANIADSVELIEIPREQNIISHVVIGEMTTTPQPEDARAFVEFVTSESGQDILREKGYRVDSPWPMGDDASWPINNGDDASWPINNGDDAS